MINFPIILASASPRRLQLLQQIGLNPTVRVADIDELSCGNEQAEQFAMRLAAQKGRAIVDIVGDDTAVIGADTVVVLDDLIMGKPRDEAEAEIFMHKLSGREHRVLTALALFWKQRSLVRFESTKVEFVPLSDDMIKAYLETGDYKDKAGGYGIQSFAAVFIPRIDGCFFNVMGFPLHLFYRMGSEIGLPILSNGGSV